MRRRLVRVGAGERHTEWAERRRGHKVVTAGLGAVYGLPIAGMRPPRPTTTLGDLHPRNAVARAPLREVSALCAVSVRGRGHPLGARYIERRAA